MKIRTTHLPKKKNTRTSTSKSKDKDEDGFDPWTDDDNTKKKQKKKKQKEEESAEEETSDKEKDEEEEESESTKKKPPKRKSEKKNPTKGMKLEPADKVTSNTNSNLFDFSAFDSPDNNIKLQPTQARKDDNFGFDDFSFDNSKTNQSKPVTQSRDFLEEWNGNNVLGNGTGTDDIFGAFESSNGNGVSTMDSLNEVEVTIKKTTLSGAIKEEKVTMKKGTDQPKQKASGDDAWGLGGNLVNLDNLSKTSTTYAAFNPDAVKKSGTSTTSTVGSGMPQLTTYGTNRPQFTSLGGMNVNSGMGMNPGMGMGMNTGMGMGMNPGMGMGMNPGMGMSPGMNMGMGMNPGMNMGMGMNPGMNPQMGNMGTGMNFNQGFGNSNQSMW